jgi:hypothetical protein
MKATFDGDHYDTADIARNPLCNMEVMDVFHDLIEYLLHVAENEPTRISEYRTMIGLVSEAKVMYRDMHLDEDGSPME